MKCRSLVVLTILLGAVVPCPTAAQRAESVPALRAGAAKVDITPSQGDLPKNSQGILDRLYARAIVLENGVSTAALITIDAGAVPDVLWQAVAGQIEKELKIPTANVLLTATHTHSAGGQRGPDSVQKIVESVRLAQQRLTPARMGYGTGVSYINVNRQIIDPKTSRWWEGPNYEGPSDKTVAVITFDTTDGAPIAVYYNTLCTRSLPGNSIRSAAISREPPHDTSKTHSMTQSSPCGRVAPPAIRTRSTTSRPTTFETSGRRTTPRGASTSATPCPRVGKGWTAAIRPSHDS